MFDAFCIFLNVLGAYSNQDSIFGDGANLVYTNLTFIVGNLTLHGFEVNSDF